MASIVWALLGLTAICGTSWGYPVGVSTLTTNQEVLVSDSASSSSEEEVIKTIEAKLTVKAVIEEATLEEGKDETSHEDSNPIAEENEERAAPEGGAEHEEGESSAVENVSPSSPRSVTDSTEEVEEGEEPNTHVTES